MSDKHSSAERPQEFYIDAKWDKVIDTGLRRTVYGACAGGVLALVIFREHLGLMTAELTRTMLDHRTNISFLCRGVRRSTVQLGVWSRMGYGLYVL